MASDLPFLVRGDGEEKLSDGGKLFKAYMRFLERLRVYVICFWVCVLVFSVFVGPEFITLGNDDLSPPKSTRAWKAQKHFEERFPEASNQLPLLVLIECVDDVASCDVRNDDICSEFYEPLLQAVWEYNASYNNVLEVNGWCDLRAGSVNDKGRDTFVNIDVRSNNETSVRFKFVDYVDRQVQQIHANLKDGDQYLIGLTGFDAMARENQDSAQKQIETIDIFTIPFAMLVLLYIIGSWRLLLLSLLSMAVSVLTSFSFMVFVIKVLGSPQPEGTTAQLMEVIVLALNVDYSLFMLRRFRDEIEHGRSVRSAIYTMMHKSGHVVAVCGVTLMLSLLCYVLIPLPAIRMDGLSVASGILICMIVTLSLTPSMLFTFPTFFSTFSDFRWLLSRCKLRRSRAREEMEDGNPYRALTNVHISPTTSPEIDDATNDLVPFRVEEGEAYYGDGVHPMYQSYRFRITKLITTWPYNIISIIVLYLMVVPLAVQVTRIDLNQDILHMLPRHSESTKRLHRMFEEFPGGTFAPFFVMVDLPEDRQDVIVERRIFELVHVVSERIVAETECDQDGINSVAWVAGKKLLPWEAKTILLVAKSKLCRNQFMEKILEKECLEAKEYEYLWQNTINKQRNALFMEIIVPFFPFESKSEDFINSVNRILDTETIRFNQNDIQGMPVQMWLTGFEVGPNAIEEKVFAQYPALFGVTMASVFIALSFLLGSYLVWLRLAFTLFLPLAGVFGLAVLVYQDGIFDWTGIDSISSSNGFFWSIPIMIVTMVTGLCIDYDSFLITRIIEHRSSGYDIQAAICKAVCETFDTIFAAGFVMFCAFSGLLISDQDMVNQSGWLLSTSIIIDTLVVNTILVPALISIGDKYAWLPIKMPQHDLITIESPEFTGL